MTAACVRCGGPVPPGEEGRMSGMCQTCLNGPATAGSHGWAGNAPATEPLQEAAAAGIALAEAWERFWTAVRALETANRERRNSQPNWSLDEPRHHQS